MEENVDSQELKLYNQFSKLLILAGNNKLQLAETSARVWIEEQLSLETKTILAFTLAELDIESPGEVSLQLFLRLFLSHLEDCFCLFFSQAILEHRIHEFQDSTASQVLLGLEKEVETINMDKIRDSITRYFSLREHNFLNISCPILQKELVMDQGYELRDFASEWIKLKQKMDIKTRNISPMLLLPFPSVIKLKENELISLLPTNFCSPVLTPLSDAEVEVHKLLSNSTFSAQRIILDYFYSQPLAFSEEFLTEKTMVMLPNAPELFLHLINLFALHRESLFKKYSKQNSFIATKLRIAPRCDLRKHIYSLLYCCC